MKKFIVNSGRGLIELSAWVILIVILVLGFVSLLSEPLTGICIILIGLVLFIAVFYLLYLFIDIRDLLKEIVDKKNEKDTVNDKLNKEGV